MPIQEGKVMNIKAIIVSIHKASQNLLVGFI